MIILKTVMESFYFLRQWITQRFFNGRGNFPRQLKMVVESTFSTSGMCSFEKPHIKMEILREASYYIYRENRIA